MKNGSCPKGNSSNVYFKNDVLRRIVIRAEKPGDWKNAK